MLSDGKLWASKHLVTVREIYFRTGQAWNPFILSEVLAPSSTPLKITVNGRVGVVGASMRFSCGRSDKNP